MNIGVMIKRYLEEKGISQAHISRETGIDVSKLNLGLNGNRRLTFYRKKKDRFQQKQSLKVSLQVTDLPDGNCDDIIRKYKKSLERLFESSPRD